MKKYLLLTGLFAILTFNSAHAQGYYYEDDSDYVEQPRRVRRVIYQQPKDREVEYIKEESPRYRRVSSSDTIHYREPEYSQDGYYKVSQTRKIRPYIGLDIASQSLKMSKKMKDEDSGEELFKDKTTSVSGVVGIQLKNNFAIEAYYQQSSEENKTHRGEEYRYVVDAEFEWSEKFSISYKSYGADLLWSIPINQEFEILTALGLGQYDFEAKVNYTRKITSYNGYSDTYKGKEKKDFDSLGIRLGLGAQYYITDNIALRGMFRYIKMTDDDYVKHLTEFSLGMRYMF